MGESEIPKVQNVHMASLPPLGYIQPTGAG